MVYSTIPLSSISSDPEIVAFFKRGERDIGEFVVPATQEPVLTGGEAVSA